MKVRAFSVETEEAEATGIPLEDLGGGGGNDDAAALAGVAAGVARAKRCRTRRGICWWRVETAGDADLGRAGGRRRIGDHGLRIPDRRERKVDLHRFHRHHPYGRRYRQRHGVHLPGAGGEPQRQEPASGRAEATPRAAVALDFAYFANGEGITSDLVFVNVATHPIRPVLYFYDQEGHLIDPESVVDLTEDLEGTEDGALSVRTEMEPLGELTISTHGQGEVVSGSVKVVSNGPIGGVLRFDLPGIGVAGVGASPLVRDALFPARRQAGGISTAAAIHNPGGKRWQRVAG